MWRRFVKNTLWLSFGEVGGRLLRIVLVLYAARVLGAADWGIFSYALSLAALFTILADIGLGAVLTRELVKNPDNYHQYASSSFFIKITFLLIASGIIIFITPLLTNLEISTTLLIFIVLLVISDNIRLFAASFNRALEKMHLEAAANIITQMAIVTLGVWILKTNPSSDNLGISYLVGSVVGSIYALWTIRNYIKSFFSHFDKKLIKKLLNAAWPFALLGLLGAIMLNTDIIMLGWLKSASDVGYYSAAQKIIFTLYILPSLIGTAAFPGWIRMANRDKEGFKDLLEKSLKIVFLISLPITIGGLIIGSDLITIFYGQNYQPASLTFKILLLSLVLNYPISILGNALFAYDQQKEFIKYAGIGAISNIIFNFALIPIWGIEGAAISTVITQAISNILVWNKMKQLNEFSVINKLFKIIIATLLMGLIVLVLHAWQINFLLILASAIAIYLCALLLMKESIIFDLKKLLYAQSSN